MTIRILVVDDNNDILENIKDYFMLCDGWVAECCSSAQAALYKLSTSSYDALILDIGLPDCDGVSLTRELRKKNNGIPILMLTARDTIDDRVNGLTSGADDYLIKPFSLRELAARIQALLRRSHAITSDILKVGDLTMNLQTLRVSRGEQEIHLNPTCLQLLQELMKQSPKVVSRHRLESVLWQGMPPASDSLRSNLYLLRQAVDKPFNQALIQTHPGLGWALLDNSDKH